MDVSEPASVAMAPGTAAVLRTLAGTDAPLTIRELARISAVSSNRAQQVIARLADHGLVTTEDHGRARLCRLNREHLAAGAMVQLAELRGALLGMLRSELETWPVQPEHASLFGSAARGDGSTASDLDVLLVTPSEDEPGWAEQLADAAGRLHRATGNNVVWFVVTPADLRRAIRAKEPIVAEWRRDAIQLAGADLSSVLRRAS